MRSAVIFSTIFALAGCATVVRDENANWCAEWNGALTPEDQKLVQERNYSPLEVQEFLIKRAEANSYIRVHRELVGILDKNASSVPLTDLEAEVLYFTVASGWLRTWQDKIEQKEKLEALLAPGEWKQVAAKAAFGALNERYQGMLGLDKRDAEASRQISRACENKFPQQGEQVSFGGPAPYLMGGFIPPPNKSPSYEDLFSRFNGYNRMGQLAILKSFFADYSRNNDWNSILLLLKFHGRRVHDYTSQPYLTPEDRTHISVVEVSLTFDRWLTLLNENHSHVSDTLDCTKRELETDLSKAKNHANFLARRLLELPERHLMSHLLVSRVFELSGSELPDDVKQKIPSDMRRWDFGSFAGNNSYLLDSFEQQAKDLAIAKRGGGAAMIGRTIASGFLIGLPGMRWDYELVPKEMHNPIGLRIVGEKGTVKIPGLYNRMIIEPCVQRGVFDFNHPNKPGCGEAHIKLDAGWKDSY